MGVNVRALVGVRISAGHGQWSLISAILLTIAGIATSVLLASRHTPPHAVIDRFERIHVGMDRNAVDAAVRPDFDLSVFAYTVSSGIHFPVGLDLTALTVEGGEFNGGTFLYSKSLFIADGINGWKIDIEFDPRTRKVVSKDLSHVHQPWYRRFWQSARERIPVLSRLPF
jgi:hypothetical protein